MFGLFKKTSKQKNQLTLSDLDGNELNIGDKVLSLRYDLGECTIVKTDQGVVYESEQSKDKVSWIKMIDAATERQKVKKITTENKINSEA